MTPFNDPLAFNPFAALTFIAAPAVLTNASSVLAMSTSNRFLRASERMRALRAEFEHLDHDNLRAQLLTIQVPRVEKQAVLLLSGLGASYIGLGAFATASLVSLVGATAGSYAPLHRFAEIAIVCALLAGLSGVAALVWACSRLFQATRLSMLNIIDEADCIRRERIAGEERARADENAAARLRQQL